MASATIAAKAATARIVTATLRRNGSSRPAARSRVRCGRIDVWTAWKSCSGARAIRRTLKAKPASAAARCVSVAFTSSGPALRKVCSASMIASTAPANPAPRASVSSPSGAVASAGSPASVRDRSRRRSAHGTTDSERSGAAAMPSATAACPCAMPTTTARANAHRDADSTNTSSPYSPKRRCPARKPRAK